MRVVIQRVSHASVRVEGRETGTIAHGMVVLLGIDREDGDDDLKWLSNKVEKLRIFEDDEGHMNRDIGQVGGEMVVVSQFTLFGNLRKGSRPSFNRSASPRKALPLYRSFVREMEKRLGKPVVAGSFGAMMEIDLTNDGPVTLIIDSKDKRF
ncbi:MAG: D-tyrosyl-tRNA(Tyr) deacylase [Opitutae bacterium]|nr:D-tyrosyl-tRNA(Tyr) deacylase [Opitutae bacterium]